MKENTLLKDLKTEFQNLSAVRILALDNDTKLLSFLLERSQNKEEFKRRFFEDLGKALIFKKESFLQFLDLHTLNKSYTSFINKIGLLNKNTKQFLRTNDEVVLNFAFKDCVLKGSQTKDESKTEELFFNEILAESEIDVLFAPKALHNFELCDYQMNKNDEIMPYLKDSPNLLIKGNNLLALHSLKHRKDIYAQVKLIYIDPPYNTGNDSFNYNDNFNHSTYLCFMKNRLEIAREFLRDDGVIFIQCDDNEQAYLKVLCDEVFGRENFVACVVWLKGNAQNDADTIQRNQEYILCYARNIDLKPISQLKQEVRVKAFKDEKTGQFYYEGAGLTTGGAGGVLNARVNLGFTIYYNPKTKDVVAKDDYDKALAKVSNDESEIYTNDESLLKKGYEIIRPPKKGARLGCWTWVLEKFNNEKDSVLIRKSDSGGYIVLKKEWLESKQVKQDENGDFYAVIEKVNPPKSFVDFVGSGRGTTELKILYGTKVFNNPKPEALLKRIIEISTKENDLVMDFFAGSGTTLAVAHKMNRRYVGIEQMDYIETITKERLKKVVNGEQGGVSKQVGWNPKEQNPEDKRKNQFMYCELMPLNILYKKEIIEASKEQELEKLYKILKEKAFIDYRVDIQEILKDKDFQALDFENKKAFLLQSLDSNMDYVLFGDLEDKDLQLSKELIALNKAFYEKVKKS